MTSWNPGDQSGQPGQQPGYGQQQPPPNFDKGTPPPAPPAYGQPPQPPAYGQQPPPAYGQQPPPPAYGQQQPAYGGNQYGPPPTNQYGAPQGVGGLPPGAVGPLSMGNRVVAFIIDYLIFLLPIIIFYATVLGSIFSATSSCGYTYDSSGVPISYDCSSAGAAFGVGGIIGVIVLIAGLALDIYMVYLLGSRGQTPGKKWMGVKVVDNDSGQVIGFGRAFLRYIVQGVANIACYAGLWSAWLDGPPAGRYRGWHDKAVNSVVISVK